MASQSQAATPFQASQEQTLSQRNAQQGREFGAPLHSEPYAAIDASAANIKAPYVVCVIGGRGAAGGGLARSFARAGASGILLAARTRSALDETAKEARELGAPDAKVVVADCDVSASSDVGALAETIKREFDGRLDAVVVNAGYSGPLVSDITAEDPADFQRAMAVNTTGFFNAAHHLIPLLIATPGGAKALIGISSASALTVHGPINHSNYLVSKFAQARLVQLIFEQWASKGLFTAAVHPGGLKSDFSQSTPDWLKPYLTDSPDLVGSFCVWLSRQDGEEQRKALNGRWLSCKWDVEVLKSKYKEIVDKDLLKFRLPFE